MDSLDEILRRAPIEAGGEGMDGAPFAGDPDDVVYLRHAPAMRRIAFSKFRVPAADVDNLVHDVFATYLFAAFLAKPGPIENPFGYLTGGICNASRRYWRRKGVEEPLSAEDNEEIIQDGNVLGNQRTRLRGLLRRQKRENKDAKRLLAKLVPNALEFAFLNLDRERLHTAGCVQFLSRAAHDTCESNPLHARSLAEAAIRIAGNLRHEFYSESAIDLLRASACCERSNALRYLGDFDEAHASLDRAEEFLMRTVAPPIEYARVDYIRATLLWKQRVFDEALRLVRLAGRTFGEYGEQARQLRANIIEANILFDQHDVASALTILLPVYEQLDKQSSPRHAAGLANNIGNCYLELHEFSRARRYFEVALRSFEDLGPKSEVARTRWNIAYMALLSGDRADAIHGLRVVKDEFESLEMLHEAALVISDLIDALHESSETLEIANLSATVAKHLNTSGAIGDSAEAERLERAVKLYLRVCYRVRTVARVSELAQKMGVSREHVSRLALRVYGHPLSAELRRRQLAEAERLIRTSSLKVSEVAAASAFGHISTFQRLFRRAFGVSPAAYRQKITKCE